MPNNHTHHTLSFSASVKVKEDLEYLVRELNHENLSNGSMLKTNKSEVLRRIVAAGLKTELGRLRQRKVAELDQIVGNSCHDKRDVQIVNPNIYNQAKEAYSNGC